MKLALLIVDMQKTFLTGKIDAGKIDQACEYINYVSGLLRSGNNLIVHVQDVEGLEAGNEYPSAKPPFRHAGLGAIQLPC